MLHISRGHSCGLCHIFTEITIVVDIPIQVVGCDGRSSMTVSGVCDQPHISTDPIQVFPRRAKIRPDSAKIARHYIMSSGQLEFGPLLAGRDCQGYK